jgi:N,N-dimethylformamidase beta subunit-like protein
VRRLVLVVLALAFVPSAHTATPTLDVSPRDFSPALTHLSINASIEAPDQVGVELASAAGAHVGWISPAELRQTVSLSWDGLIDGRPVLDGSYLVRLTRGSESLATSELRVDRVAAKLQGLAVGNGNVPFAGDNRMLTTVTPNGDGLRDSAIVRFRLAEPAEVTLEVSRTTTVPRTIATVTQRFGAGGQALTWRPSSNLNPRTYLLRVSTVDAAGNRQLYGAETAYVARYPRAPVVRVRGIDAGFTRPSYAPGQQARLVISTDAPSLSMRVYQIGPDKVFTYADNQLAGVPVTEPEILDWSRRANGPAPITFGVGPWASGFYFVELKAPDGRVGYAPFVVRPSSLGGYAHNVAVVLPTNTWQAYNQWDRDGNGFGDTWYAGPPNFTVDLARPYNNRGVPPRLYRYDLPFLHWLYWTGKSGAVDFLSDSDFALIRNGDKLAKHYDLLVFEGHEEYATQHMFDVVERYRDLGGNLMFLSANNFFWRVTQKGQKLRKAVRFRQQGQPEARLLGVQYRANDDGRKQGLFTVRSASTAPWLWTGTGLADGSTFGQPVGGYGIEIDAMTRDSPPGTMVLAEIPDLYGPGLTAQMTYYETPAGAKVFAAGVLDFGGSVGFEPMTRLLENLWSRLAAP